MSKKQISIISEDIMSIELSTEYNTRYLIQNKSKYLNSINTNLMRQRSHCLGIIKDYQRLAILKRNVHSGLSWFIGSSIRGAIEIDISELSIANVTEKFERSNSHIPKRFMRVYVGRGLFRLINYNGG